MNQLCLTGQWTLVKTLKSRRKRRSSNPRISGSADTKCELDYSPSFHVLIYIGVRILSPRLHVLYSSGSFLYWVCFCRYCIGRIQSKTVWLRLVTFAEILYSESKRELCIRLPLDQERLVNDRAALITTFTPALLHHLSS